MHFEHGGKWAEYLSILSDSMPPESICLEARVDGMMLCSLRASLVPA